MVNGGEPADRGGGWSGGWGRSRGRGRSDADCCVWVFRGFVVGKFFVVDGTVLLVEVLPSLNGSYCQSNSTYRYICCGRTD